MQKLAQKVISSRSIANGRMVMTANQLEHRSAADPVVKEKAEILPDVIEERRRDGDGRIMINKFATGKLLGKVNLLIH